MKNYSLQDQKNSRFELEESSDKIIIRFRADRSIDDVLSNHPYFTAIQSNLVELAHFPEANSYVYKINGATLKASIDVRNKLRKSLKEVNDVIYAGRVLQYKGTNLFQIYTENIFLKFYDQISTSHCRRIIKDYNLVIKKNKLNFCKNGYFVEAINKGQRVFDLAEKLLNLSEVECSHPELIAKRKQLKRDFEDYYYDPKINNDWSLDLIKAKSAWSRSTGKGIKIAVIDDGLDLKHPAFKNKIIYSKDMLDKDGQRGAAHRYAQEGHGTACASIAVANEEGKLKGVAPNAKLIAIRSKGLGSVLEAEAFYEAVQAGADIISCSWGPPDGNIFDASDNEIYFPIPDHTRIAIDYAAEHGRNGKGCIILFAAGNGKEQISYDGYASNKNVLAIGAINKNLEPTIYSDFGTPIYCVFPSGDFDVDEDKNPINETGVVVADPIGVAGYAQGDYFDLFTGTSASCPGVAGIIALMLEVNQDLKVEQIKDIISKSCEKIGKPSDYLKVGNKTYSPTFGYGLLRADLVIENVKKLNNQKKLSRMNKSKVHALHIGVNTVDPSYYGQEISPLFGCVNDMNNMADLVKYKHGPEIEQIKLYAEHNNIPSPSELPTTTNIIKILTDWSDELFDGDLLIITYAGHGASLKDENGDEVDGMDESWVCYDKFLRDDDLDKLFQQFNSGVSILLISDSCHSGSVNRNISFNKQLSKEIPAGTRYVPASVAQKIYNKDTTSQRIISTKSNSRSIKRSQMSANLLLLAACQDDEFAQEKNSEGIFTKFLKEEFYRNPNQTYAKVLENIKGKMPSSQEPRLDEERDSLNRFKEAFFLQKIDEDLKQITNEAQAPTSAYKNEIESAKGISVYFKDAENENNTLSIKKTTRTRSDIYKYKENIKVKDGSIPIDIFEHSNEWDSAYELLNNLDEEDAKGIDFIEPEIVSNIFKTDELENTTRSLESHYLKYYPNPKERGEDPYIWHLGDEYSQLRSAFINVHRDIYLTRDYGRDYILKKDNAAYDIVTIGHIDTGIIEHHPMIPENFDFKTSGGNIYDYDKKLSPGERQGHGQATIALLAGGYSEIIGDTFGAHPAARVITYKISETVAIFRGKNFRNAINKAIEDGCEVITMSMAGWPTRKMAQAINDAYEAGIVVVSAASNSFVKGPLSILPKSTLYPARWDRTIAAVGVTIDQTPYLFEKQASNNRAAGMEYMQMCIGPKEALETTIAAYTPNVLWFGNDDKTKNYYSIDGGGTSAATPQIAAAAGLYIDKYREEIEELIPEEELWMKAELVRQAIFMSAEKRKKEDFGRGIIKANNLVSDAEFAPAKIFPLIQKAKKAEAKGGFFSKLKTIYRRGENSKYNLLEEMMSTELLQLVHKDPELYKYIDLDTSSEFSDKEKEEFSNAVLQSNYASEKLKSELGGSYFNNRSNSMIDNHLLQFDEMSIKLTTDGVKLNIEDQEEYVDEDEEFRTYTVKGFISPSSTRSIGGSSLQIQPYENPENELSVSYFEYEIDGEKFGRWILPNDNEHNGIRSGNNEENRIQLDYLFNDEVLRGTNQKLPITIHTVKVEKEDKLIDEKNKKKGLQFYDLKKGKWISSRRIKPNERAKIKAVIKKQDNVLLMFHGLFATMKISYTQFLENKKNAKHLEKIYGRYLLGYNMFDARNGIQQNAEDYYNSIKDYIKKDANCNVIARSRGCIVARYFNEVLSQEKTYKLNLNKIILIAPPNQGTPVASPELHRKLADIITNVLSKAIPMSWILQGGLKILLRGLVNKVSNMPGISDVMEGSELLTKLNTSEIDRSNYYIFVSNYEPSSRKIKNALDNLIDNKIFKGAANDLVVPFLGAQFLNADFIAPEEGLTNRGTSEAVNLEYEVNHFQYLKNKIGSKKRNNRQTNKYQKKIADLLLKDIA